MDKGHILGVLRVQRKIYMDFILCTIIVGCLMIRGIIINRMPTRFVVFEINRISGHTR